MVIVAEKADVRESLRSARRSEATIGFVPTMGFLHDGHLSLFRAARERCEVVVASIFVNPTQFAPGEDLESYPRDAEGDAAKARACGVDVLWTPTREIMYAADHSTQVVVERLQDGLCGRTRPHHFRGVAQVVSKLFHVVGPTHAFFGEKDYQQLAVLRRMVRDLDFDIEVVGCPLVREADGLAMSSRNAYLSVEERERALALSRGLFAARALFAAGERAADRLVQRVRKELEAVDAAIDYVEVVDAATLEPQAGRTLATPAVIAVAASIGATRLIDNVTLGEASH